MPKSESPRIEALEALLAERRKHETYLAKLEERRASTPEHVYKRLRDEYATKLTDLQVRAAMEADALAGSIEADEAAVAELEAKLATVVEERIEGELRAEVGEYEPKEWSKKLAVLNATISQLEKERDARSGAFERTRSLIGEATSFGGRGASEGASTGPDTSPSGGAGAAPTREPSTGGSDRPGSGPSKAPASMSGGPSFDELAFLNSVVGRVSTSGPVAPSPAPPPPPRAPTPARPATPPRPQAEAPAPSTALPAAPPAAAPPVAPPPPRHSGAVPKEPASGPSAEPATGPSKEPPTAPRASAAVPRPAESSFSTPPASADEEPPSPLGRPTPRTSQAIKTLKCQECGTLNYPTEWYCERCGGELAAL